MVTKWVCPPEVGMAQAFEHPILEILATPLHGTHNISMHDDGLESTAHAHMYQKILL